MICLVEGAGAALTFEIIQDIGQRGLFEYVAADDKGPGGSGPFGPVNPQPVGSGCGIRCKVDRPELPIFPFVDWPAVDGFAVVDRFAGGFVDEVERC
jgi:hypothetical protein